MNSSFRSVRGYVSLSSGCFYVCLDGTAIYVFRRADGCLFVFFPISYDMEPGIGLTGTVSLPELSLSGKKLNFHHHYFTSLKVGSTNLNDLSYRSFLVSENSVVLKENFRDLDETPLRENMKISSPDSRVRYA